MYYSSSDKNASREPWRSLPAEIADVIEPELEATTDEILATIAREVPDYARPLEGSFGRGVRTGVTEALRQFVELIRSPSGARGPGARSTSRSAAASCARAAHSTRCSPPIAWARGSPGGDWPPPPRARASSPTCSACSPSRSSPTSRRSRPTRSRATPKPVRASRASAAAGATSWWRRSSASRRRTRPICAPLAETVGWRLPRTAAALACDEDQLDRLAARLPADALAAGAGRRGLRDRPRPRRARAGVGRSSEPSRAAGSARTPCWARPAPPGSLGASWSLARATLRAVEAGAIEAAGLVRADDVLTKLLLFENAGARGADRHAPARAARPPYAQGPPAHGGDGARVCRSSEGTPQPWRVPSACIRRRRATASAGFASCSETHWTTRTARFEIELALRARLQAVAS